MSVVKELIRTEADGGISFGDYELAAKAKKSDFEHRGDPVSYTHLDVYKRQMYGTQTGNAVSRLKCWFENDVKMYGTQTP